MTVLAPHHPPVFQDRRHHTQDRQRVFGIAAVWGALTLLAAGAALLQPDDAVLPRTTPAAALPVSALQAPAADAAAASWIGVVPNTTDDFEPPAPTF